MDTTSIILKTDSRRRVRTSPERREALLAEFARSGLSGIRFAALAGVCYSTFAAWVQQRKRPSACMAGPRRAAAVRFAEAVPAASAPAPALAAATLRLTLPGGAFLDIGHAAQAVLAAQLIKALA